MGTSAIDTELLEAREDIKSLKEEITRLEDEKFRLQRQLELDQDRLEMILAETQMDNEEEEKTAHNNNSPMLVGPVVHDVNSTEKLAMTMEQNSKMATPQDSQNVQQRQKDSHDLRTSTPDDLLEHKYFDESIQELLVSLTKRQRLEPPDDNTNNTRLLSLTESIYRFTGLTAFPIDQSHIDDELIGLRFDVFTDRKFHTPHYVILRKTVIKNDGPKKWTIFRHTLPAYVPLDEYSELLDDYFVFARAVRRFLVKIQYNHDKFARIRHLSWVVTTDLRCELVLLVKDGVTITVSCGLEEIESVEVKGLDPAKKSYVEAKLWRCSVANLMKTMRKINV